MSDAAAATQRHDPDLYPWPGDEKVIARLREALAHTDERAPRPVCRLELPAAVEALLRPGLLRRLRQAAVLVPVVRRPEGPAIVLTRRASGLRAHGGQVSFPGGRREESDRSLAEAALREAAEEIGLDPESAEVIGYLDDYPTLSRFLVTPVVALVEHAGPWRPDPREVAEVFELPLHKVLRPRRFRRRTISRGALKLPYLEIEHDGHRIWGATAGMLWDLNRKVNGGP